MSEIAMSEEYAKYQKWYYWYRCPLVPIFKFRKANENNCADISFQWLVFRVWSGMSPQLKIELGIDDHLIVARLYLPYLYLGIFIPFVSPRISYKLWRVPRRNPQPSET